MIQQAMTSPSANSSQKCLSCGFVNFAGEAKCKRCTADLSPWSAERNSSVVPKNGSPEPAVRKGSFAMVGALVLVLLVSLGAFYLVRKPKTAPEQPAKQSEVSQVALSNVEEGPAASPEQIAESGEAATSVIGQLERMQDATMRNSLTYEEYNELLNQMTTHLNRTLPSFIGHQPGDEKFRIEMNAAVRDYKAARDWWKTTIQYNNVLTEADRLERLNAKWESARTHLSNAEKAIGKN
jgi:hypothetical protein